MRALAHRASGVATTRSKRRSRHQAEATQAMPNAIGCREAVARASVPAGRAPPKAQDQRVQAPPRLRQASQLNATASPKGGYDEEAPGNLQQVRGLAADRRSGWGAAGGGLSGRNVSEPDSATSSGEPAVQWRIPDSGHEGLQGSSGARERAAREERKQRRRRRWSVWGQHERKVLRRKAGSPGAGKRSDG